jgi:hypothetical protein
MTLADEPGGTRATLATDVKLSGRVAAMGKSVIADVAAALVATFAENLAAMLAPEPVSVPEPTDEIAPAPAPRPAASESLPVARIAASVIATRLSNPRTLAIATTIFAVICIAIGFAIGRLV